MYHRISILVIQRSCVRFSILTGSSELRIPESTSMITSTLPSIIRMEERHRKNLLKMKKRSQLERSLKSLKRSKSKQLSKKKRLSSVIRVRARERSRRATRQSSVRSVKGKVLSQTTVILHQNRILNRNPSLSLNRSLNLRRLAKLESQRSQNRSPRKKSKWLD